MNTELEEQVLQALSGIIDPEILKPITELDMVGWVSVTDAGEASAQIKLTIVGCPASRAIERDVREALAAVPGVTATTVEMTTMTNQEKIGRASCRERVSRCV